jgi:ADP-ribosyl-[dinitrogen reductase] hydrolase
MPQPLDERGDRFRAAILGMAIGDALGFSVRGSASQGLRRVHGLAEDFVPRARGNFAKGQFSDDTQLMLAAAESVIREQKVDAKSAAAHLVWLWQEGVVLQPPDSLQATAERLMRGIPWMSAGAPMGIKEPSVLSRSLVAGLWSADSSAKMLRDSQALTVITHKDPTCAAASAAYAQAIALAVRGELNNVVTACEACARAAQTHDSLFAEELRHLPRLFSWEPERALAQLRKVGVSPQQLAASEGVPEHVTPVLLTALYLAFKFTRDFRECVGWALTLGGELDVVAALSGALWSARTGLEAIPVKLRRNVLYADHLVSVADRLFEAWRAVAPAGQRVAVRALR